MRLAEPTTGLQVPRPPLRLRARVRFGRGGSEVGLHALPGGGEGRHVLPHEVAHALRLGRRELQHDVVVRVERAAHPERSRAARAHEVERQQVLGRPHLHEREAVTDRRDLHPAREGRLVDHDGIVRAHQDRVVVGEPDERVREALGEGPQDGPHVLHRELVEREPLRGDPARSQPRTDAAEVLGRVQVARPARPRVDRVGGDHVELLLRGRQVVTAVVEDDLELGVVEDVVVPIGEGASHAEDALLDLREDEPFDLGMDRGGSEGHRGSGPEDEHPARVGVQQHRDVPERPLELHVHQGRRRFRAAVDDERLVAAHTARDAHGLVDALAIVDDLDIGELPAGDLRRVGGPAAVDVRGEVLLIPGPSPGRERRARHEEDARGDRGEGHGPAGGEARDDGDPDRRRSRPPASGASARSRTRR